MDPGRSPTSAALPDWVVDHYDALYRYAYRLSGTQADAEDLVQQAFLVAFRKRDQLRDEVKALPWLRTLLRNEFLQGIRKPSAKAVEDLTDVADRNPSAEESLCTHEDRDELQGALARLAPEFRIPLLMFHLEELSYREIAEALGIPAGTVMSRISRGRSALRDALDETSVFRHDAVRLRPNADNGPGETTGWRLRTV